MGVKELCHFESPPQTTTRRSGLGRVTIVICQNVLFWMALYVGASTIYILVVGAINTQDIPSAVMYLVASMLSLFYLCLQNVATRLRSKARNVIDAERVDGYQSLAAHTLPILLTMWMVASGLCITFTAARQPLCALKGTTSSLSALDRGNTCIINRTTIVTGLVGMFATIMLFVLMRNVDDAHRCHLFGVVPQHKLLPLLLSHPRRALRTMPSEMSFKCRSSTSISSQAMAPKWNDHTVMPGTSQSWLQDSPQDLGIHNGRASAPPTLLQPRPSLSTIRSRASLPLPPPPSSPLPPLPAYQPLHTIRPGTTAHKAIYPPRSFSRPIPTRPARSDDTLRLLQPPAPALSRGNLAVLTRSHGSLSSIYSRDTTGESQIIPRMDLRPSRLTPTSSRSSSSSSSSSSSTKTVRCSPPGTTNLPITGNLSANQGNPTSEMSDTSSETSLSPRRQRRRRRTLSINDSVINSGLGVNSDSATPSPTRRLDERLKKYAESQSQIRQRASSSSFSGGGEMALMKLQAAKEGRCPERFRFE